MPERTRFGALALDTPLEAAYLADNEYEVLIPWYSAGAQTASAKKNGALVPFAATIVGVRTRADTAPVGAALITDLNINGTTAFTTQGNRPTIADGANVSSTTLPDVTAVAAGDRLTYDVDQIGSGTAGSDLYVVVTLKRALV